MFRILPMLLLGLCLLSCSHEPPPPAVPSSLAPESVARGRELVRGLAACGVCHGETPQPTSVLAGGRIIEDEYGSVSAPNITPAESGIGPWTDADVMRAFRASIGREGEWLAGQVHRGYEWMSDEDAQAIVNYLRTLPPVEKNVERRSLSFMDRNTKGFFDSRPEVSGFVPAIDRREVEAYGQYLTDHVARCGGCHNSPVSILRPEEYLAGGRVIRTDLGEKVAPAISSSKVYGLGDWSEAAIVQYLKTGVGPDGGVSDAQFCPTGFFRNAAEEDLVAIARYLRTVPG